MKTSKLIVRSLAALFMLAASGEAATLFDTTSTLLGTDPTQLGRLSRTNIPSDWSATKAFPGLVNTSTSYHYQTFTVNAGLTPYIQVSIDDPGARLFTAAYLNSYNPASQSTNYLGDAGFSGNPFGNPNFFQVVVPVNQDVVIVVEDTTTGSGGVGQTFGLLVEGFLDTNYTEPTTVPEPSTVLIGGAGLLFVAARRLRRPRA